MTMISFRVDEIEANDVDRWAERLGVGRSELIRDAVHKHLTWLKAVDEIDILTDIPLTDDELALADAADWGPAEDWSDWADAER